MRATKGAAAIESGTIAATVPIEVLTISLDNGKVQSSESKTEKNEEHQQFYLKLY